MGPMLAGGPAVPQRPAGERQVGRRRVPGEDEAGRHADPGQHPPDVGGRPRRRRREEEQREGEHVHEGARLAHPLDVDADRARCGQREHDHRDEHLAHEHEPGHPPGHRPVDEHRHHGHAERDAVGRRVEDLADDAVLVQAPRQPAVDPVGGAEDRQDDRRAQAVLPREQQPYEDGDEGEAQQRDQVRPRQDAGPARPHLVSRRAAGCAHGSVFTRRSGSLALATRLLAPAGTRSALHPARWLGLLRRPGTHLVSRRASAALTVRYRPSLPLSQLRMRSSWSIRITTCSTS